MSSSATLTDRPRQSEFVKYEVKPEFCETAGTIKNTAANTIAANSMRVGQPLNLNGTQWETIVAGGEAGIEGFLIDDTPHEQLAQNGITRKQYKILARGPAMINKNMIPDKDQATSPGTFNKDTLMTAAYALNIREYVEPTKRTTQSELQ